MAEKEPWQIEKQIRAEGCLAEFLKANPDYSVDESQPECRGGTNFITFGAYRDQPVVYKYFDFLPRKKQEEKALLAYEPTGLVPQLYAADTDSMLVMERLLGTTLTEAEETLAQDRIEQTYDELGRAVARMVSMAPGATSGGRDDLSAKPGCDYDFYRRASVAALFDTVIERAAKVFGEHSVPGAGVLEASLESLRRNRDAILSGRSFVQIDDFHSHNIIVDGPELRGFIDLEMTRYGNEILLLSAAMVMTMDKPSLWSSLRRGYEGYSGKPIDSRTIVLAKVAAPFSQWIRFMWYWTTDPQFLEAGERTREWPIRDIKAIARKLQKTEP